MSPQTDLKRPDFVIIGAQKCGTTWLHQQLATHPQIMMPKGKDDEFFSYLPDKPLADYCQKFIDAEPSQLIGDSCASYFWSARAGDEQPAGFNPHIPTTLKKALGSDCRYIVLLKDPVQRTISAYLHHIAHASVDCNTQLLDAPSTRGLVAISRYGHHLSEWRKQIDDSHLLVLPAPQQGNHEALLNASCDFIGAYSFTFPQPENTVFAGIRRISDESGVWVAIGQRGLEKLEDIQRPVPLREHNGRTWARLIHPAELGELITLLKPDAELFAQQIAQMKLDAKQFSHWLTWPK